MSLEIGTRVKVLPGVSNCTDAGSLQLSTARGRPADGVSREHFVGMVGEVVATRPDGMVLVDNQIVQGKPVGASTMREWFKPEEVKPG